MSIANQKVLNLMQLLATAKKLASHFEAKPPLKMI